MTDREREQPLDALIVLGAVIGKDGHPGRVARFRMIHALGLVTECYPQSFLVISGGQRPGTPCSEAKAMAGWGCEWWAEQAGAGGETGWQERLVLEEESRNTAEAARFTARLLRARGWRRAGLITDGFHIKRAAYLFRRHFHSHELEVVPLVAPGLLSDYWRRGRWVRICKFTAREAGAWLKLLAGEVSRKVTGAD